MARSSLSADAGATGPVIDITPVPGAPDIDPYAYEGTKEGIAANVGPAVVGPWWVYLLIAVGLYSLWED